MQQLLESGDASKTGSDIHVNSDVLCNLDEASREILGLPEPWPGRFELECSGCAKTFDFVIKLKPVEKWGAAAYAPRRLKGPFLEVNGVDYLPDAAQWLALSAVEKHLDLAPAEKPEETNLLAINAIKLAAQKGAAIDLKHFAKLDISIPDSISVAVIENVDGSLRLLPNLGDDVPPEKLEMTLGQLETAVNAATLRIGNKIILFDEPRLKAAHEILANRVIPARDKWQFFHTPGAFLDAAQVDLDMGFSLRVHGATLFRKAYFGYGETSGQNWFDNDGSQFAQLIPLKACSSLIMGDEDLAELESLVEDAQNSGTSFIYFRNQTIILPENKEETAQLMAVFRDHVQNPGKPEEYENNTQDKESPRQITVDINLHDTDIPAQLAKKSDMPPYYAGDVFCADYKYRFYPYQEEGARWIASLFQAAGKPDSHCGGLLADDMGLGKTFMVLAAMNIYLRQTGRKKPLLAIMPVVLLENWRQEIERVFLKSPFTDLSC